MICDLVTQGVITGNLSTTGCGPTPNSLDRFYFFATDSSADAALDICGNANPTLNGATFTASQGFVAGGTTGIDTGFNPTTAPTPNFTQNNASFGIWSNATVEEAVTQFTNVAPSQAQGSAIYDFFTDGKYYMRLNEASSTGVAAPGSKGLFAGDRSSSSVEIAYWDGGNVNNVNVTSAAPVNGDFFIGKATGETASPQSFAAAYIGGFLGATKDLAMYTEICAALTTIRGSC